MGVGWGGSKLKGVRENDPKVKKQEKEGVGRQTTMLSSLDQFLLDGLRQVVDEIR